MGKPIKFSIIRNDFNIIDLKPMVGKHGPVVHVPARRVLNDAHSFRGNVSYEIALGKWRLDNFTFIYQWKILSSKPKQNKNKYYFIFFVYICGNIYHIYVQYISDSMYVWCKIMKMKDKAHIIVNTLSKKSSYQVWEKNNIILSIHTGVT